ncbi:MAG: hypothetical protein LBG13_03475 [Holosporales bacterium]|nr:hypothetical protein [Holosporales bacterium]
MGQTWDKKFFLHKNKKACYHIINTCSCGLSFLGKFAGLTRRVLVYVCVSWSRMMVLRNRSRVAF